MVTEKRFKRGKTGFQKQIEKCLNTIDPYDEKGRGQGTILDSESFTRWLIGVRGISARARTQRFCIPTAEECKKLDFFK